MNTEETYSEIDAIESLMNGLADALNRSESTPIQDRLHAAFMIAKDARDYAAIGGRSVDSPTGELIDTMLIATHHLEMGCASSLIEDHLAEVRSHLYRIDGFLELNEAFEGAEEVEINDD